MENEMKRIDISGWRTLDSVVQLLLAHKANGDHVYCVFNGHRLESDTVTMDSAYMKICGKTKEQFDADQERIKKQLEEEDK